jgi:predicted kinase
VRGHLLICEADPETVRRRLEARRGDASDADWVTYQRLAGEWEALGEATRRKYHAIDTGGAPEEAVARALAVLTHIGLWG